MFDGIFATQRQPCNGIDMPFAAYPLISAVLWRDEKVEAGSLGFFSRVGVEIAIAVLTVATLVETIVRHIFLFPLFYAAQLIPPMRETFQRLAVGVIFGGYVTMVLGGYSLYANLFSTKIYQHPSSELELHRYPFVHSDDFYKMLGVNEEASTEEIHDSFMRFAQHWHPDKNSDPRATEMFQNLSQAHQVLMDPETRLLYDNFGKKTPA